jgi:acetyl-CoA carboxylase biotin carboxyl carrier protein
MTKPSIPLIAETTGTLWKITARLGEQVLAGAELFVLESMKMEIPVEAEVAGCIGAYHIAEGQVVEEGQTIATFDPA